MLDGRTKAKIIQRMYDFIFMKPFKEVQGKLDSLIKRNTHACRYPIEGFKYKMTTYGEWNTPSFQRLAQQFVPEFEELLKLENQLIEENSYIESYLKAVLNLSNNPADWIAILPDCLHKFIKDTVLDWGYAERTLDSKAIQQLNQKNKKGIELLSERLALNLLL